MTSHDHSNFTDTNNPRSYSTSSFKYVLQGESSEVRLRNTQKEDIILVIILEGESGVVKETIVIEPSRRGSLKRTSWHIDYIESLSRSTLLPNEVEFPHSYSMSSFQYVLEDKSSEVQVSNTQKDDIVSPSSSLCSRRSNYHN
ncbi:hypothetical protein ACE6H2_023139 [Prunus campanulata]